MKNSTITIIAVSLLIGLNIAMYNMMSDIKLSHNEMLEINRMKTEEKIKILKKIIECESSGRVNVTSKTGDHGLFQINIKLHSANAKNLGLDLKKPVDNMLYGIYLFETEGFKPWKASRKCWEEINYKK